MKSARIEILIETGLSMIMHVQAHAVSSLKTLLFEYDSTVAELACLFESHRCFRLFARVHILRPYASFRRFVQLVSFTRIPFVAEFILLKILFPSFSTCPKNSPIVRYNRFTRHQFIFLAKYKFSPIVRL